MLGKERVVLDEQSNFSDPIQNILRYCEQFPQWDAETKSLPNKEGTRDFVLRHELITDSLHIGLSAPFGNKRAFPFSASYFFDGEKLTTDTVHIQIFPDKDFLVTFNWDNSYGHGEAYKYSQDTHGKAQLQGKIPYFLYNGVPYDDLRPLLTKESHIPGRIDLQQTGLIFLGQLLTRNYNTPQLVEIPSLDTFVKDVKNGVKEILWMK